MRLYATFSVFDVCDLGIKDVSIVFFVVDGILFLETIRPLARLLAPLRRGRLASGVWRKAYGALSWDR
jgi:hypothetical protein